MKTTQQTTTQQFSAPRAPRAGFLGRAVAALAVLCSVTAAAGAASAAQVWVAAPTTKVRPQQMAPAGAATAATLAAAKNEFEAFHVIVSGAAAGVSMSLTGLSDDAGHTISGRDIVLYREALIEVAKASGGDGAAGTWPDALVPDVDPIVGEKRAAFPFDVPANESRNVLVDIHVPAGAPAGIYKGTLKVTGGTQADVPVSLQVWDFEIPSTSTLKSAFTMSWNGPCFGHSDGSCSNHDAEVALRKRYLQAALDNHISISTPAMGAPVRADGSADWLEFDSLVGPSLDGTSNTRLVGAKTTAVQIQSIPGFGNRAQTAGYAAHFKAKGWFGTLFNYICDEPPLTCAWDAIPGRIAESKAGDAAVPTLITTSSKNAAQHNISGIDLFVPVVNFMEDRAGTEYAGSQRANYGSTVWWYQSCMSFGCAGVGGEYERTNLSGWPSYAVDTDGTRNRAQEWMSFTYGIQGELYYETMTASLNGDAWTNQYYFGGTGDGTLFYPGTRERIGGQTEIPVESLRLKGIRDGMEDYELLNLAAKLGQGDKAKQIALNVYKRTYEATTTAANLADGRAQLAALILHALGKDVPPTTVVVPPAPTPIGATPGVAADATSASLVGAAGGCSSTGTQNALWALPLVAFFALRRRRAAAVGA